MVNFQKIVGTQQYRKNVAKPPMSTNIVKEYFPSADCRVIHHSWGVVSEKIDCEAGCALGGAISLWYQWRPYGSLDFSACQHEVTSFPQDGVVETMWKDIEWHCYPLQPGKLSFTWLCLFVELWSSSSSRPLPSVILWNSGKGLLLMVGISMSWHLHSYIWSGVSENTLVGKHLGISLWSSA